MHNETHAVLLFFDQTEIFFARLMIEPVTINLRILSQNMGLPQEQVQTVVTLLDEGYPAPFIARYRKDAVGALDETKIRFIASELRLARSFAERKQAILKAIDSLGELQPELDKKIRETQSVKQLEDLYLPYKPKKQTPGNIAKERGLINLANEIVEQKITPEKLNERAAEFINEDKNIKSVADVMLGTSHIIAETFAEKTNLIHKIRELLRAEGKLVTKKIETKITQSNNTNNTNSQTTENIKTTNNIIDAKNNNDNNINNEITTDTKPEETKAKIETTEPKSDVETVEPKSDVETTESKSAIETTEPKSELETVEPKFELETTESKSEIESATGSQSSSSAANEITEQFLELREAIVGDGVTAAKSKIAARKKKLQPQQQQQLIKIKDDAKRRREEIKAKEREHLEQQFSEFFDYSCCAGDLQAHKILAFNRGEREKVLRVSIDVDEGKIFEAVSELVISKDHKFIDFLSGCLKDAIHRLLIPVLVRELRIDMTEYAEAYAVRISSRNLRSLLLLPPLKRQRVLAIDPGFKRGCQVVPLDEFGNVLGYETVYLSGGSERRSNSAKRLAEIIERFKISVIAIGNGTGSRETEMAISKLLNDYFAGVDISYVIVNEVGASAYAISSVAREEFPNYDSAIRGAISVGRRLQDALRELVKIEPEALGVGTYQYDVKVKRLREVLYEVVESCVNFAGVDVNLATPSLLRYVAGLNKFTAKRIYDYRLENGHFRSRDELIRISGVSGVTFTSCAGFLRIYGGVNPFDETWIHPESYQVAVDLIEKFGFKLDDLRTLEGRSALAAKINAENIGEIASKYAIEFGVGVQTITDILSELLRFNSSDPRDLLPKPIFKRGVLRFEDLRVGMELSGSVLNVVEFGVFVDVGLQDPGLVHISQVADHYIRDAYDKVAVGDIVRVWVTELDDKRRRISLTMLPPGTVKEAKRGNIASNTEGGGTTGGERKQRPIQRRDLRRQVEPSSRPASGSVGGERPNAERSGIERSGVVRPAGERAGVDRSGVDRSRVERSGVDRSRGIGRGRDAGNVSSGGGSIDNRAGVRNGQVIQRDQRSQRTGQQVGSPAAGRFNRATGTRDGLAKTASPSQTERVGGENNRDRNFAQDRTGRFNRGERGDRNRNDFANKHPKTYVSQSKPKELKPITEKMKQGKEPLRSFADLAQLLGRVQVADNSDDKKQKKKTAEKISDGNENK
jgi:uncharacterized protein